MRCKTLWGAILHFLKYGLGPFCPQCGTPMKNRALSTYRCWWCLNCGHVIQLKEKGSRLSHGSK